MDGSVGTCSARIPQHTDSRAVQGVMSGIEEVPRPIKQNGIVELEASRLLSRDVRRVSEEMKRVADTQQAKGGDKHQTPTGEGEMAQTPGLPPGWKFAFDEGNTIYYYSHDLGISQYEHPGAADCLPEASVPAAHVRRQSIVYTDYYCYEAGMRDRPARSPQTNKTLSKNDEIQSMDGVLRAFGAAASPVFPRSESPRTIKTDRPASAEHSPPTSPQQRPTSPTHDNRHVYISTSPPHGAISQLQKGVVSGMCTATSPTPRSPSQEGVVKPRSRSPLQKEGGVVKYRSRSPYRYKWVVHHSDDPRWHSSLHFRCLKHALLYRALMELYSNQAERNHYEIRKKGAGVA